MIFSIKTTLNISLLLLMLNGCGGGDGGEDGSRLSVSQSHVDFSATTNGSTPDPKTVNASITNLTSTVYLGVFYTDSGIDSVVYDLNSSAVPITIYPKSPSTLSSGTYTDEVTVMACNDENCNSQISGSPYTVSVTYRIKTGITTTPNALNFSAVDGENPANQTLTLHNLPNGESWKSSISYVEGDSHWLSVIPARDSDSNTVVTVDANAMPTGTYHANIIFSSDTLSAEVPVTYVVEPVRLDVPTNTTFNIDLESSISDTEQNVTVSTNTSRTLNWSATSNASWLTVSPNSGDTDALNTLTLSLDLDILKNPESSTFNSIVTITTNQSNAPDVYIAVELNLDLPMVKYLSPYVIYDNQPHKITIKGSGFLHTAGLAMSIGDTTTYDFTVVDDSEIDIEIPALPVGEYSFKLSDSLGLSPESGRLLVKRAPQYKNAVILTQGRTSSIEYDPERDAFFVVSQSSTGSTAQRIRYDGTQWSVDNLSVQKPIAVGLTTDGTELLVTKENCEVAHVDPETLEITYTGTFRFSCNYEQFGILHSFDDGQILIANTNQWSEVWEYPSFTVLTSPSTYYATSVLSRKRNLMLWAESPFITKPRSIYIYSSKTNAFNQFAAHDSDMYFTHSNLAISDDGNRIIHKIDVYDENQSYIGSLSGLEYNIQDHVAISPDGLRGYVLKNETKNLSVYDLSNPIGPFLQIGNDIELPCNTIDRVNNFVISYDGSAAFVFGEEVISLSETKRTFCVIPLP
ncbi:MAG: hypothetical protein P8171_19380 [Candidatus Thiodiazotropha sp.]